MVYTEACIVATVVSFEHLAKTQRRFGFNLRFNIALT
jgi:hypothetical protein